MGSCLPKTSALRLTNNVLKTNWIAKHLIVKQEIMLLSRLTEHPDGSLWDHSWTHIFVEKLKNVFLCSIEQQDSSIGNKGKQQGFCGILAENGPAAQV